MWQFTKYVHSSLIPLRSANRKMYIANNLALYYRQPIWLIKWRLLFGIHFLNVCIVMINDFFVQFQIRHILMQSVHNNSDNNAIPAAFSIRRRNFVVVSKMPAGILQSKNAVCAFLITYKIISFTLEDSKRNQQTYDQCSSITTGSIYHIKHINVHTNDL